jgi:hypothetical protein
MLVENVYLSHSATFFKPSHLNAEPISRDCLLLEPKLGQNPVCILLCNWVEGEGDATREMEWVH